MSKIHRQPFSSVFVLERHLGRGAVRMASQVDYIVGRIGRRTKQAAPNPSGEIFPILGFKTVTRLSGTVPPPKPGNKHLSASSCDIATRCLATDFG